MSQAPSQNKLSNDEKCLSEEFIIYKAKGGTMWSGREKHLSHCDECQQKVLEKEKILLPEQKITLFRQPSGYATLFAGK